MSTFSFTIPAADVNTIKDTSGSSDFPIAIDRGFSRASTNNLLTAQFGDGYSQRVKAGINSKNDSFNIALNNRSAADIALVAEFFDLKSGIAFDLTITDTFSAGNLTTSTIKVICSNYNISYTQPTIHSLTAVLTRVYEP